MDHYQQRVIIVGGGIAGLTAAATLARNGVPVVLLEQNHQVGGLMAGIWRQGFYFDAGDMSLEDAGIVFALMRQLGLFESQQWERADYRIKTPDFDMIVQSYDQVVADLQVAFPHEAKAIKRLFHIYQTIGNCLGRTFRTGSIPHIIEGPDRLRTWSKYFWSLLRNSPRLMWASRFRADRLIHKHISDSRLRNFLESAGYPGQATLVAALFWYLWIHDYWYPRIGLQAMLDGIAAFSMDHGGQIRYKTRIVRILTEADRVRGIETATGEIIPAETVIFTGDLKHLYCGILKDEPLIAHERALYEDAALTYPLLSLYVGVAIPQQAMQQILQTHHTYYFPSYDLLEHFDPNDPDMHEKSWIEISCPSLRNAKLAPPGCSSLILQCFSHHDYQDGWALGPTEMADPEPKRTPAYRQLKQAVTQQLLERAEAVIPNLRDYVIFSDLGTPRSTRRFTLNSEGASSGWSWDPHKSPLKLLQWCFTTPIKGLWTAGHYTMWPGCVPSAALSAKIVADKVLRHIRRQELA